MKVGGSSQARWDKLLRFEELDAGRLATPRELENKDAVKSGGNVFFVDKAKKGEPSENDIAHKRAVIDDDTGKAVWVDEKRTRAGEEARVDEINGLRTDLGVKDVDGARRMLRTELEQFQDGHDQRFQSAYHQGLEAPGARNNKVQQDFSEADLDVRVTKRDLQGLGLDAEQVVPELNRAVLDLRAADYKQAGIQSSGQPKHPSELEGPDLARWQRVQLAKSETDGDAAFLMKPTNHPRTSAERGGDERLAKLQGENEMLEMANEMAKYKKRVKGQWASEMRSQMTSSMIGGGKLGFSQIQGLMNAMGVK